MPVPRRLGAAASVTVRGALGGERVPDVENRTITIDRDDRKTVLRGHLAQLRSVFILLGVVTVLFVVAAGLSVIGRSPSPGWGLAAAGVIGAAVVGAILVWSQVVLTRKQLPLGSEFRLAVTDETLDLDGPAGSERIRWGQLSSLKRVGGGLYIVIAPTRARLGVPGRLISDEALARAVESIGRPTAVDDHTRTSLAASDPAALSSSIAFTAADQRVARAALLRGAWKPLAVVGGLGLIGVAGSAAVAVGILPREFFGCFAVVAAVAVISVTVLVVAVSRTVRRSLTIGMVQTLTLTPDALELTGPGGMTRLLWSQLSGLKRAGNAVIVTSTPAKAKLAFVGRAIDDELYTAIEQRIRMAQASGEIPRRP